MTEEPGSASREPEESSSSGMLRLDLHLHSDASPDSDSTPENTIAAVKAAGLNGLALTDHNSTANNERMAELARKAGLLFIPGCEISSEKGHILAYDIDREMPKGLPPSQVVRMAQLSHCLVMASHPFRLVTGLGPIISIDLPLNGIEVLNAHSSPMANAKADVLADSIRGWRDGDPNGAPFLHEADDDDLERQLRAWERTAGDDEPTPALEEPKTAAKPDPTDDMPLARIGGSDAHTADRVGLAWTEFPGLAPGSATVEQVLEALSKGECRAGGRSSTRLALDYQLRVVWNRVKRGFKRI